MLWSLSLSSLLVLLASRSSAADELPLKENTHDLWFDYGEYVQDVAAGHRVYVRSRDSTIVELDNPFRPNKGSWREMDGGVDRIDVGANGSIHIINRHGQRYSGDGTSWTYMGTVANGATDIGADAVNGNVCWIGTHANTQYGGPVYCNGVQLGNGLLGFSIDVMSNGMPIGINKEGTLYKATGSTYADPQWVALDLNEQ